jgi:large repetitive protein
MAVPSWMLPSSPHAPSTPTVTSPVTGSTLSTTPVRFDGAADPGVTVRLQVSPSGATYETTATPSGSWQRDLPLPNGSHGVRAVAIDQSNIESAPSALIEVVVDTVAPAAPHIGTPAEGSATNQTLVRFSGLAEPGATLRLDEGSTLATLTVNGDSTWSVQLPMSVGPHTVTARVWDAAGHPSPATVRRFTVDLEAPGAPEILTPSEGALLSPSDTLIAGRGEPGADIFINRGALTIATVTAASDGTWFTRIVSASGSNEIHARQRDRAGNFGPISPIRRYTVDDQLPVVQITTPDNQVFLPGQTPLIAGVATDNIGVQDVRVDFYDLIGRGIQGVKAICDLCPTGSSVEWRTNQTPVAGRFVVKVYANDRVGNRSFEQSIVITVVRAP